MDTMSVLVRDSVHHFVETMSGKIQKSSNSTSYGVIITKCTNTNPKYLVRLESYLNNTEPELSVETFFDDRSRILVVILPNQNLSNTHYMSLVCKDYLERYDLLDGQVVVASFPESGEPTDHVLSQLFRTVKHGHTRRKGIHLYVGHSPGSGVSSILIADSEEVSREFIKMRLELKGYDVHEARDGSEAFEKFSLHTPDLVITELNLPVLDGYQLIHKIKEEKQGGGNVIVLTEKHLTKDMNRAFEIGASDYVTKPFSITELEWRIKKLHAPNRWLHKADERWSFS